MRIRLNCTNPQCQRAYAWQGASFTEDNPVTCPYCQQVASLDETQLTKKGELTSCLQCSCDEMFIRKDFPQKLGLLIVVAAGVLSCVLFAKGQLILALGALLAVVVIDLVVYFLVPFVTVCYRCHTDYSGVPLHPDHKGFDLATAEKYRGAIDDGTKTSE